MIGPFRWIGQIRQIGQKPPAAVPGQKAPNFSQKRENGD
jgi:hypothetical protein